MCIGVPAVIGKNGVERIIELPLNEFEKHEFTNGVKNVKEAISLSPTLTTLFMLYGLKKYFIGLLQ